MKPKQKDKEALRRYIEEQEWKRIFRYGRLKAKISELLKTR